ncbi:hypothetical protein NDU88_006832 [Pleurodeles waltl]|uniref:Uncharacterized protein n=1 Tax=Pleurodeles waltl TaxID=8319 RepID=A0AAV7NUI5_PLEWA|nr:hypothetical protein NDU88_006832 [Pleurodeles waltl]
MKAAILSLDPAGQLRYWIQRCSAKQRQLKYCELWGRGRAQRCPIWQCLCKDFLHGAEPRLGSEIRGTAAAKAQAREPMQKASGAMEVCLEPVPMEEQGCVEDP